MIHHGEPILLFAINRDTEEEPFLTWKLLAHQGIYIGTVGMGFVVCIGVYCLKRIWCRPVTQRHQCYSPVSSHHAIVDDDVEVAPIYGREGMVGKPIKPHDNHDLCMEQEATRLESHCKQPALLKAVSSAGLLTIKPKSRECN